jgi:hypothetical protein
MFKNYDEFLNESKESSFNHDNFIKEIEHALKWNDAVVKEIEPDENLFYIGQTPEQAFPKCNAFFLYHCLPGQSVRKDILDECKNLGYTTARVKVVFNSSRHERHEYLIALTVPHVQATARKYGI